MKKKLIIGLSLILLLFTVGGMVVAWNLDALTKNQENIQTGLSRHHNYLSALSNLQSAQIELYRFLSGQEGDISILSGSVKGLEHYINLITEGVENEGQKGKLAELSSLTDDYTQRVNLLLTYPRDNERKKLEEEATALGRGLEERMHSLYAVSEFEVSDLAPLSSRIISRSHLTIYFTLMLSGLLAIGGAIWIIRGVSSSVGRLISGTEAIASGDYLGKIEVTDRDELGILSERFNHMTEAISKRDNDLQSANEELESTNEELQSSYDEMERMTAELERAKNELEVEHRRLIEAKEYLQNVLEDSPDIIITTDINGNIVEFNKGAEDALGYKREQVIGTPADRLYFEKGERQKLLRIVEEKGRITNYEGALRTFDGKGIDVSLTLSQLRDSADDIIGTVGISRDIRDIKKRREEILSVNKKLQETAQALESARADLEHKVDERTRELREANERLTESNIRIKEADRLKSEFMANMSHELRTPLNAIIGFSELLIDGIDGEINEVQKVDLNHIHDSGQHLLSIINDILDLSKIEAGRMELLKEEVDLIGVIRNAVSVTQPLLTGKVVKLLTRTPDELPCIMADGKRIKQIILNLMSNAAKFTERGEIVVSVAVEGKSDILISVADTGIGIRDEDISKVFEKFRQVDMSSTRNKGGTGLGMAITKRLVELHGGEIWLESKFGAGTTFFVRLPTGTADGAGLFPGYAA